MAEWQLIQERTISGKGLLRVPSDISKRRFTVLYADIVRKPKSEYGNFNYYPPKSVYAFLTFSRDDYVIGDATLDYPSQAFDSIPDITGQNLIAIKCAYDGILQSFINFATAMSLPVVSVVDTIKDYEYLDASWDEVRVKCYADTAIKLRLYSLPFDKCKDDADKKRKPPKPPPAPPPVPQGTPVTVDPPYEDDEENPDVFTDPYNGDEFPPPPLEGETCQAYKFKFRFFNRFGVTQDVEVVLFGEYGEYGLGGFGTSPDGQFEGFSNAYLYCRGGQDSVAPPPSACLPEVTQCFFFGGPSPFIISVDLISVTPI